MIKNIELLEAEINSLGPAWNLFGQVDKMKLLLKKIKEDSRNDFEFQAEIQKKAFTALSNHGILELKIPYGYNEIESIDQSKRINVKISYEK